MKTFCVTLLVIAVLANYKVLAVTFECYECEGDTCSQNLQLIVCSADTVATPKPPELASSTPTASSSDTTLPTVATTTTTSSDQTTSTTTAGTTTSATIAGSTTTTSAGSTTTQTVPPTTTTVAETTTSLNSIVKHYQTLLRKRRDAEATYACYTLLYDTDDKSVVKKGCVESALNACDIAADGAQGPVQSCTICKDTKCNSSAAIKSITMATILLIFFTLFA